MLNRSLSLLSHGMLSLLLACTYFGASSAIASEEPYDFPISGVLSLLLNSPAIASEDPYDFPTLNGGQTYTVQSNEHWQPITHSYDVVEGSILDMSHLLDAPAGKYGKLIVQGDHYEFQNRPGEPVKFYGNQIGLEGISKPECDKLAERFARMGYNNARIHLIDQDLTWSSAVSTDLDPNQLDTLDYLFNSMKERGIYLSLDLYVARVLTPGEIAEYPQQMQHEFKLLAHFTESAHQNWLTFTKNLLNHVNPYTELAWKNDPALATISLLNEDTPYHQVSMFPTVLDSVLNPLFLQWASDNGVTAIEDPASIRRFLTEGYVTSYERKIQAMRDLGVVQPLSGVSFMNHPYQSLIRDHLDFVDDHCYYDHPVADGPMISAPLNYRMMSNEHDFASLPRTSLACSIVGKPVSITEFGQVYPNAYRASSGIVTAAYAGLQDWDALNRFKYASTPYNLNLGVNVVNGYTGNVFAIANDPIALLSDKAGTLLFSTSAVKPANSIFALSVSDESYSLSEEEDPDDTDLLYRLGRGNYPEKFKNLGLISRIGTIVTEDPTAPTSENYSAILTNDNFTGPLDGSVVNQVAYGYNPISSLAGEGYLSSDLAQNAEGGIFLSDQGQIQLDTNEGSFQVVTELAEGFSGEGQQYWSGNNTRVYNGKGFASIFFGSMDGESLSRSQRILLLYLTDVLASGTEFGNPERTVYVNHGTLPHLVRVDQAIIEFKNNGYQNVEVWAVDLSGNRIKQIVTGLKDDYTTFSVSTSTACVYEIIRN